MAFSNLETDNINKFAEYYDSLSWFGKWLFPIDVNNLKNDQSSLVKAVAMCNEGSWLFNIQCFFFPKFKTFFNSDLILNMKKLINFNTRYQYDIGLKFQYDKNNFPLIENFLRIKEQSWAKSRKLSDLCQLVRWKLSDELIEKCCHYADTSTLIIRLRRYHELIGKTPLVINVKMLEKIFNHTNVTALLDFIGSGELNYTLTSSTCSFKEREEIIDHFLTINPNELSSLINSFNYLYKHKLLTNDNLIQIFDQLKLVNNIEQFNCDLTKNDNINKDLLQDLFTLYYKVDNSPKNEVSSPLDNPRVGLARNSVFTQSDNVINTESNSNLSPKNN